MMRLHFAIILCSILWITGARSQGVSRTEIDFLDMDTRWSLSELNTYMTGKCSKYDSKYDTSRVLWGVDYDSVYCGGMLGKLHGEQINTKISILFSSPIYLGHRFALPDTSECIDNGYLPSRDKYEKLKRVYSESLKKRSITEDSTGEASTFNTGSGHLELRYDRIRPAKGEVVLIHMSP